MNYQLRRATFCIHTKACLCCKLAPLFKLNQFGSWKNFGWCPATRKKQKKYKKIQLSFFSLFISLSFSLSITIVADANGPSTREQRIPLTWETFFLGFRKLPLCMDRGMSQNNLLVNLCGVPSSKRGREKATSPRSFSRDNGEIMKNWHNFQKFSRLKSLFKIRVKPNVREAQELSNGVLKVVQL